MKSNVKSGSGGKHGRGPREADFQAMVLDMAELFNWRAYHTRDSRGSTAGFPDLVLVRGSRLVFAELKTARGKVSDAQTAWLNALASVPGIEVHLWKPGDVSEIEHVLQARHRGRLM